MVATITVNLLAHGSTRGLAPQAGRGCRRTKTLEWGIDRERQMERRKRAQEPFIKVVATAAERAEIKRLAGAACMSVSAHIRALGLSWILKSKLGCQAVLALASD
jgi:hypothetical protein